jgi:hypothetical protein
MALASPSSSAPPWRPAHGGTWRPPWVRPKCSKPAPGVAMHATYRSRVGAQVSWSGGSDAGSGSSAGSVVRDSVPVCPLVFS